LGKASDKRSPAAPVALGIAPVTSSTSDIAIAIANDIQEHDVTLDDDGKSFGL